MFSVPDSFKRFMRDMTNAGKPGSPVHTAIMSGVKSSLQARLKDQFARGVGPDDKKHDPTKRGKPALVSRKLGNAARVRASGNDVYVEPKTAHVGGILDTHQDGHTFPARGGKVYQYRDRRGRLISYSKFVRRVAGQNNATAERTRGGSYEKTYFAAGKTGRLSLRGSKSVSSAKFGARVLPPRPIRPVSSLTRPWQEALAKGITNGAANRLDRYAE